MEPTVDDAVSPLSSRKH